MPDQPMYHSQILAHLGLIAGLFDELSLGDVLEHATHQHPERRDLTVGEAVNAMVLHGLGCINQALDLVPRFFHHTPPSRLISPRVVPAQLNDDALGRALDTLYADGVTDLYRLIAATAAERLGLAPRFTPLDRPSFHVDGRYTSDEEPEAQVIHMTRGYRRDHRPDLNQVMWELMVEHQAGIPLLLTPLRGHSSDAHRFGALVRPPIDPLHTPYGMTSLVADSALDREDNLAKLSQTQMQWLTRVPAPVSEAHAALAQVTPQTMMPLSEGDRGQMLPSTSGRVAPRWALISSERRQPQAQRTADRPWRKQRDQDRNAFPKRCRPAFACEADAQQALRAFEQGLQVTPCTQVTIRPVAYSGKRGRPGPGA